MLLPNPAKGKQPEQQNVALPSSVETSIIATEAAASPAQENVVAADSKPIGQLKFPPPRTPTVVCNECYIRLNSVDFSRYYDEYGVCLKHRNFLG